MKYRIVLSLNLWFLIFFLWSFFSKKKFNCTIIKEKTIKVQLQIAIKEVKKWLEKLKQMKTRISRAYIVCGSVWACENVGGLAKTSQPGPGFLRWFFCKYFIGSSKRKCFFFRWVVVEELKYEVLRVCVMNSSALFFYCRRKCFFNVGYRLITGNFKSILDCWEKFMRFLRGKFPGIYCWIVQNVSRSV